MSDTDFPSSVHVLRPRKVSVSKKLDGFLDQAGLAHHSDRTLNDSTRPSANNLNAMTCADCGQIEYLTREYCRCGHYLGGQLQDEYLAWEQQILAEHEELSKKSELTLRPLRLSYFLAIPFMLVPAVNVIFWSEGFVLATLLWWMPVALIAGAGVFAENYILRPLKKSAWFVDNYTIDNFIAQRCSRKRE